MIPILQIFMFILVMEGLSEAMKLKQMLMFSRHNIRAPFYVHVRTLTRKPWPKWNAVPGELTPQGAMLEEGMGEYFQELFGMHDDEHKCPDDNSVYIYTNMTQRIIDSAQRFSKGAFKNCNMTVHIHEQTGENMFWAAVRNDSEEFKERVTNELQDKIYSLNFTNEYLLLNKILELNQSESCEIDNFCDFNEAKVSIDIVAGDQVQLSDPLFHAYHFVDTILMAYLDGMPLTEIAWGALANREQVKSLVRLAEHFQYLKFSNYHLAKDSVYPMLKYISELFLNEKPKFTLLFGFKSVINYVLTALKLKPFEVLDQLEQMPPGAKVVFQKWFNEDTNENLFRLNLYYQTIEQMRHGTKASKENPPNCILLQIEGCDVDENGFCPWEDFLKALRLALE